MHVMRARARKGLDRRRAKEVGSTCTRARGNGVEHARAGDGTNRGTNHTYPRERSFTETLADRVVQSPVQTSVGANRPKLEHVTFRHAKYPV